jgi:hypothetical protein
MQLLCPMCARTPDQIDYSGFKDPSQSNDEYVLAEEGTLDPISGFFLCDECYIKAGQPSGSRGRRWTATPANLVALKLM